MRRLAPTLLLCALGCGHTEATDRPEGRGGTHVPPEPRGPYAETCVVPGTESARPVERFVPPPGCELAEGGLPANPRVVSDEAALAATVRCEGGMRPSIDLTATDLVVVRTTLSPASAGVEPLDDGTGIVFVSRFRSPCPDDPMPMPTPLTLAFLLPKGAPHAFREANCSFQPRCR